jgi:hypothetical protein
MKIIALLIALATLAAIAVPPAAFAGGRARGAVIRGRPVVVARPFALHRPVVVTRPFVGQSVIVARPFFGTPPVVVARPLFPQGPLIVQPSFVPLQPFIVQRQVVVPRSRVFFTAPGTLVIVR